MNIENNNIYEEETVETIVKSSQKSERNLLEQIESKDPIELLKNLEKLFAKNKKNVKREDLTNYRANSTLTVEKGWIHYEIKINHWTSDERKEYKAFSIVQMDITIKDWADTYKFDMYPVIHATMSFNVQKNDVRITNNDEKQTIWNKYFWKLFDSKKFELDFYKSKS